MTFDIPAAGVYSPGNVSDLLPDQILRWSRFLRQAVKVDLMTKRMIHHEDTQAVHG
jgi:hypothetical protein